MQTPINPIASSIGGSTPDVALRGSCPRLELRDRCRKGTDVGLTRRLAVGVGIGFIGVLPLIGCAATAPSSEDLATSSAISVPRAHRFPTDADTGIDPDCPYLIVKVSTPGVGFDSKKSRALQEIQRPFLKTFSAHLERVGFRLWEPVSVRLERAGFTELGAWWGRFSVLGVNELNVREAAELEEIMAKLTPDERARAEQIWLEATQATWVVDSSVLDISDPFRIRRPRGGKKLAWSWTMSKIPSVLDGALRVDLFTHSRFDNPRRRINRISQLRITAKSDFGSRASKDADLAAAVFLPHVRQLCADMSATLSEEEAELELLRERLTVEIIRVRERRAEHEKHLELEIE